VVAIALKLKQASIILRELGEPTVTNVPGITSDLRTGDPLQLDAARGQVSRRLV